MTWLRRLVARLGQPNPKCQPDIKESGWVEARIERVERAIADEEIRLMQRQRR